MKKIFATIAAASLFLGSVTSCSKMLDIPQHGVLNTDNFYQTDEDALSAVTAIYAEFEDLFIFKEFEMSYNWLNSYLSDEFWHGQSDRAVDLEMLESFTFDADYPTIETVFTSLYNVIGKCNVVLDNVKGDSDIQQRARAEAKVFRAWMYFELTTLWGNPPLVDHVMAADVHPSNTDHAELMAWIIKELDEAAAVLPSRGSKTNRDGAVRMTKEAAWAIEGKAQVFAGDYNGAKTTLKKVIDSGMFELVPGTEMWRMFHASGDCSTESVFEFNYVHNVNLGFTGGHTHGQRANSCTWRDLKKIPMPFIQINDGWGGGGNPSKSFVEAIMQNEPDSYRRKAWLISYEELLTDYEYTFEDDKTMTKEQKLMDPRRGLSASSYFGNVGWFMIKYMPLETERPDPNDVHKNDNNTPVMRYAEVLLLYAEACAQTGDNSGLTYLNMVAERAGAPTYSTLTMENVKKEKRFEMFMEGTRFPDLVRWGDAATVLKDQGKEVPSFVDPFDPEKGIPHQAVVDYSTAYYNTTYGFQAGKNELMPYPLGELQLNAYNEETGEGIKQNPGW